jgi:membrane protein implicated in regulation of membrane protease activity
MPPWFADWQAWLGLAMLLGVAELFSLDLMLLMLAVGALVGMVTAALSAPVALQIIAAVAASVGMLALVRPSMVQRLHAGPELTLGPKALIGKQALVVDKVSAHGGQIRLAGELWTARAFDETQVIEAGSTVDVFEIKGATAYVHEVPQVGE